MIVNQIRKMDKDTFLKFKEGYIDYLNSEEYHVHYLNGANIRKEQDYFNHFKEVYAFGKHFGNNRNAFIDCMRDLDNWDDKQGFVLVIYNYSKFLDGFDRDKELFTKALNYIAFYLEKECLTTSGGYNHLKSFDVYLINEVIDV